MEATAIAGTISFLASVFRRVVQFTSGCKNSACEDGKHSFLKDMSTHVAASRGKCMPVDGLAQEAFPVNLL